MHLEDVFHVLEALLGGFVGLRLGINASDEVFVADRDACDFADATGNHKALVIAALPFALRVERHGNKIVDALKQWRVLDAQADLLAKENAGFLVTFVFQLVDEVLYFARFSEEETGSDGMELHAAIERLRHGVVSMELVARMR